eukprot:scaffold9650_cov50-Cyclotella_meneghiniana.AAC.1
MWTTLGMKSTMSNRMRIPKKQSAHGIPRQPPGHFSLSPIRCLAVCKTICFCCSLYIGFYYSNTAVMSRHCDVGILEALLLMHKRTLHVPSSGSLLISTIHGLPSSPTPSLDNSLTMD